MAGYDILGNVAILKFEENTKAKEKKKVAFELLAKQPNIITVLEKKEKVKGRLRTIKTSFLAGKKTKEAVYRENGCVFKLNVEKCYFSPRLSNERIEVARMIKPESSVLVMFAGVSPFSVVIAKLSRPKIVVSVELGRECCKYGKENVKLNKLGNVEIIQGDVKKKVNKKLGKFDYVVMPRPQLKDTFLKEAFSVSKSGTKIIYYDFGENEKEILGKIEKEAKKAKKKISITNIKTAGDIAPHRFRYRVEFEIN